MNFTWLQELISENWFAGFLSGVGATLLGFVLTIIWDIRKSKREDERRDLAITNSIYEDCVSNATSITQNISWLTSEIEILSENKSITQPLILLKTGFWELAKAYPPKKFLKPDNLAELRSAGFLVEYINEGIRNRENYKSNNEPMSNFKEKLKTIDQLLLQNLRSIEQKIIGLTKASEPKKDRK